MDDANVATLTHALRQWRYQVSRAQNIPPYWVLSNRMLDDIARLGPTSLAELCQVTGMGKGRTDRYGEGILLCLAEARNAPADATGVEETPPWEEPVGSFLRQIVYAVPPGRHDAVLAMLGAPSPGPIGHIEVVLTCREGPDRETLPIG